MYSGGLSADGIWALKRGWVDWVRLHYFPPFCLVFYVQWAGSCLFTCRHEKYDVLIGFSVALKCFVGSNLNCIWNLWWKYIIHCIRMNGLLGIVFEPTSSSQVSQPLRLLVDGSEGLRLLLFHASHSAISHSIRVRGWIFFSFPLTKWPTKGLRKSMCQDRLRNRH